MSGLTIPGRSGEGLGCSPAQSRIALVFFKRPAWYAHSSLTAQVTEEHIRQCCLADAYLAAINIGTASLWLPTRTFPAVTSPHFGRPPAVHKTACCVQNHTDGVSVYLLEVNRISLIGVAMTCAALITQNRYCDPGGMGEA